MPWVRRMRWESLLQSESRERMLQESVSLLSQQSREQESRIDRLQQALLDTTAAGGDARAEGARWRGAYEALVQTHLPPTPPTPSPPLPLSGPPAGFEDYFAFDAEAAETLREAMRTHPEETLLSELTGATG